MRILVRMLSTYLKTWTWHNPSVGEIDTSESWELTVQPDCPKEQAFIHLKTVSQDIRETWREISPSCSGLHGSVHGVSLNSHTHTHHTHTNTKEKKEGDLGGKRYRQLWESIIHYIHVWNFQIINFRVLKQYTSLMKQFCICFFSICVTDNRDK